jgi:hypothetical protein
MVVTTPDNLARTRELGFEIQGFKTRQRKNVMERVKPGDRLLYYVSQVQKFGATAEITSEGFEDHEVIWQSKPGEDYPYRVHLSADLTPEEDAWVPSEEIGPTLQFTQRYPAEHWKLAFRGNLHPISDEDFDAVRDELRRRGRRAAR